MDTLTATSLLDARTFRRMSAAISHVAAHFREQPSVAQMASAAALSEFHFSRTFSAWTGISPKRFLQQLTLEDAKRGLADAHSVMQAALDAGLSGPGRLHDLSVELEAVTPGELKSGGEGLACHAGVAATPFGPALFAWTPRGLGHLEFLLERAWRPEYERIRAEWPAAHWHIDHDGAVALAERIWDTHRRSAESCRLRVQGTNFQVQVWRALLRLGGRGTLTYAALAQSVDRPGAARAVGQAVAANPVAWLIPCHRVLAANEAAGGYRWGIERKQTMLAWEFARDTAARAAH
jgi:AraC family transcriptional regulator, regulatory protein of adaptative response / methylated-DNA-[protein]-cysteine methyltransferase